MNKIVNEKQPMDLLKAPRRLIRYLASEGIHPREVKGLTELDATLPAEWTFYAGLQYFPGHETPIEMDLIVLMDDRVLLIEIKDWTKKIKSIGDTWVVGKKSRRPNPVKSVGAKARKLKSLLVSKLPHIPIYVDSCVILTATPEVEGLQAGEARRTMSLAEASRLGEAQVRRDHLGQVELRIRTPKTWQYAAEFDEVFGDRRAFRAQEAQFDGFRITEESVFAHPRGIWIDHRAEENERTNSTALLRCWNFASLPPALNAPPERSFIAERERRVFDHLNALGSWLADGTSVLRPMNVTDGEVATDHFDLLALPATWAQVPRFIERTRGDLDIEQALDIIGELTRIVAELHDRQISHRDIGNRNVWLGGASRVGLTGFSICQMPTDSSVADWRTTLKAYAPDMPEDQNSAYASSGFRRDVYQLGAVAKEILAVFDDDKTNSLLPTWLDEWLSIATEPDPSKRFSTARVMTDEFATRRTETKKPNADHSRLDAFETTQNPYARWSQRLQTLSVGAVDVYRATDSEIGEIIVKVWAGLRRNESTELDLSLLRLLEGASRLIANPIQGLPFFEAAGLHVIGPFVAYRAIDGKTLEDMQIASAETAVSLAVQLLQAIQSLHALGYAHGDLCPKNIIVSDSAVGETLTILDLFDITPVGNGRKRTIAYCPDDHETCGEKQVDRYAAALIAKQLLDGTYDNRALGAINQLQAVIDSNGSNLLQFPLQTLLEVAAKLKEPPAPSFAISAQNTEKVLLENTMFFARRFQDAMVLTTDTLELRIGIEKEAFTRAQVILPSHRSLEDASSHGVLVKLTLEVSPGDPTGVAELGSFLASLPGLQTPSTAPRTKNSDGKPPEGAFPVREYWQRIIELEDGLLPELELTGPGIPLGESIVFPCERIRGDFDFDPLDTVDVFIGNKPKAIATLDLKSFSEGSVTFLSDPNWPLRKGDRVRLVSRRSRQSFERRRRAVDRILRGDSQIHDLLEYFDPSASKSPVGYDVRIEEEDLAPYKLNPGQRAAILKVLREGPVGLVQGPPGTGKTHFIAALVHWLTTKGGAGKILLVSQSHEAVNAALEKLIDRFKAEQNKLPLLRIGTKGISDKIRPFHTDALRERFRALFEGALKHRVAIAAGGAGIPKKVAYEAVDIERQLGALSRRLSVLEYLNTVDVDAEEARSRRRMLDTVQKSFLAACRQLLGREVDPATHIDEIAAAYRGLADKTAQSPADMRVLMSLLNLSQSWLSALSTRHRNFDEFLAKTRAIIAGTCVGVGQTSLRIDNNSFDWVIIDEAARCTSGEISVAAQLGRRLLLVGDHLQLLPMLDREMLRELKASFPGVSEDALARSDFERAFASTYGASNHCVLREQYRMVKPICELITEVFYREHGVTLDTSENREEDPRFNRQLPEPFNVPVAWLDTSDDPRAKEHTDDRKSHSNEAEVSAIINALNIVAADKEIVSDLVHGKEEKPIGIICMYGAQRDAIENAIAERPWDNKFRRLIKIETVDSYQGKENTIVIVSLSRTNSGHRGGHVSIPNRANVAFSRAKERLIIVGSAKFWGSFGKSNPIRNTLNWVNNHQEEGASKVFNVVELFGR